MKAFRNVAVVSGLCILIALPMGCGLSSTLKGGAIGAGVGGAAGTVIGHQLGNSAAGAIIGAAIGGTAGAMIGQTGGRDETRHRECKDRTRG